MLVYFVKYTTQQLCLNMYTILNLFNKHIYLNSFNKSLQSVTSQSALSVFFQNFAGSFAGAEQMFGANLRL